MKGKYVVLLLALSVLSILFGSAMAQEDSEEINIVHMWSNALGRAALDELFAGFNDANTAYFVTDNSAGHEDFKTQILVTIAGDNPPDMFSYWAGARTQFLVDAGRLMPLDDYWAENNLDEVFNEGLKSAMVYDGNIYMIPMNAHIIGFFYNTEVMETAGVIEAPRTWDELMSAADAIVASGVTPFALGSRDRWPAQFWFDYLLNRTAGPEYRTALMDGEASYLDEEVVSVMEMWKDMIDKGYFYEDANAYDWTEAADIVARGDAAMTLIGTYITGYWNDNGLVSGEDYDFFQFPIYDESIPVVSHGAVNGWIIPADASNPEGALEAISYLIQPESQALWSQGSGALAASSEVSDDIYSEVRAKAADVLRNSTFLSGYDLSTVPEMADVGLNMFAQFMFDSSGYMDYLEQVEAERVLVFGE